MCAGMTRMLRFDALTCGVATANAVREPATSEYGVLLSLADGTSAAAHKRDFGTSRWQLSNEITSPPGVGERGDSAGSCPATEVARGPTFSPQHAHDGNWRGAAAPQLKKYTSQVSLRFGIC
jgi:hypothetical protein